MNSEILKTIFVRHTTDNLAVELGSNFAEKICGFDSRDLNEATYMYHVLYRQLKSKIVFEKQS